MPGQSGWQQRQAALEAAAQAEVDRLEAERQRVDRLRVLHAAFRDADATAETLAAAVGVPVHYEVLHDDIGPVGERIVLTADQRALMLAEWTRRVRHLAAVLREHGRVDAVEAAPADLPAATVVLAALAGEDDVVLGGLLSRYGSRAGFGRLAEIVMGVCDRSAGDEVPVDSPPGAAVNAGVDLPDEPPRQLLLDLSSHRRQLLAWLWPRRQASREEAYRALYGDEARTDDALRRTVNRLNDDLLDHTGGRIGVRLGGDLLWIEVH